MRKFLLSVCLAALCWVRPATSQAVRAVVDSTAPDGAVLVLNVKGDMNTYRIDRTVRDLCIPVAADSAGVTFRIVTVYKDQVLGASFVLFYPNDSLRQVNVTADSAGVHIRRQQKADCQ